MRFPGPAVTRFLPVALLLVGIAFHGVRIAAVDDDPQGGSAFAMFSTVDVARTRRVMATVPGPNPLRLEIPPDLAGLRKRLADVPSDANALRLADELLARTWDLDAGGTEGGEVVLDQVRVVVAGLHATDWTLSRDLLADVVVMLEAEG